MPLYPLKNTDLLRSFHDQPAEALETSVQAITQASPSAEIRTTALGSVFLLFFVSAWVLLRPFKFYVWAGAVEGLVPAFNCLIDHAEAIEKDRKRLFAVDSVLLRHRFRKPAF